MRLLSYDNDSQDARRRSHAHERALDVMSIVKKWLCITTVLHHARIRFIALIRPRRHPVSHSLILCHRTCSASLSKNHTHFSSHHGKIIVAHISLHFDRHRGGVNRVGHGFVYRVSNFDNPRPSNSFDLRFFKTLWLRNLLGLGSPYSTMMLILIYVLVDEHCATARLCIPWSRCGSICKKTPFILAKSALNTWYI